MKESLFGSYTHVSNQHHSTDDDHRTFGPLSTWSWAPGVKTVCRAVKLSCSHAFAVGRLVDPARGAKLTHSERDRESVGHRLISIEHAISCLTHLQLFVLHQTLFLNATKPPCSAMSDDAVLRRPARMDRRRTEGDHHYRAPGTKWLGNKNQ